MFETNSSPHRAEVNRINAQQSTGPRTEAGKQRSSQNALQHGLTGQTVLLPSENPAEYEHHVQGFLREYDPRGSTEQHLVETIAGATWRLKRIAALEAKVFSQETATPTDVYQQTRALSNLGLYEHRLSRQVEKAMKELRELQSDRRSRESIRMDEAASLLEMHKEQGLPYNPVEDGFVFSVDEIETFIRRRQRLEEAEEAAECRV